MLSISAPMIFGTKLNVAIFFHIFKKKLNNRNETDKLT